MKQEKKHKISRQAKEITKKQRKNTKGQTGNRAHRRGKQTCY